MPPRRFAFTITFAGPCILLDEYELSLAVIIFYLSLSLNTHPVNWTVNDLYITCSDITYYNFTHFQIDTEHI